MMDEIQAGSAAVRKHPADAVQAGRRGGAGLPRALMSGQTVVPGLPNQLTAAWAQVTRALAHALQLAGIATRRLTGGGWARRAVAGPVSAQGRQPQFFYLTL